MGPSFCFHLRPVLADEHFPTLATTALTNVKQSARWSSCLLGILMAVIAVMALITKWLLLQPIHDELVRKYGNSELLFYERQPICDVIDLQEFNLITFPVACLLTLIFVVFSRRTSFMRKKCHGYIGPVVPLDFYMHVKRKFAAVVFAIVADELLDIINQVINGNTSNGEGKSSCLRVPNQISVSFLLLQEWLSCISYALPKC